MKSLLLILTINEDFTPGITQEMTLHAFDSGMVKKIFEIHIKKSI